MKYYVSKISVKTIPDKIGLVRSWNISEFTDISNVYLDFAEEFVEFLWQWFVRCRCRCSFCVRRCCIPNLGRGWCLIASCLCPGCCE